MIAPRASTTALDGLLARVQAGERSTPLMATVEDALATASLEALKLDVLRRRLTTEIEGLTGGASDACAVDELRRMAARRAQTERDAAALRARVADLREAFSALGGTRIAG